MGRKDIITKEYMEDTEVFADVFNHMIYEEKSLVLVAVRVMEEMTGMKIEKEAWKSMELTKQL